MEGRTYADFEKLPIEDQMSAVEMDCVVGKRGERQAILTLLLRRFNFQLMLFLPDKSQDEVRKALDLVERVIGYEQFKQWLGVLLTDRGSEFVDYVAMERSFIAKGKRCRVFYCNPMESCQKGKWERLCI